MHACTQHDTHMTQNSRVLRWCKKHEAPSTPMSA
jgi:hypothetical protein